MNKIAYSNDIQDFTEGENAYPIYLYPDKWLKYIDLIVPKLLEIVGQKSINIWCRGSSGAILSAWLMKSISNKCTICYIKKEDEHTHHNSNDYKPAGEVNIILDDFMRTGNTINEIYSHFHESFPKKKIDVLIIGNFYNEEPWPLVFKPKNLIIDKDTIDNNDWD